MLKLNKLGENVGELFTWLFAMFVFCYYRSFPKCENVKMQYKQGYLSDACISYFITLHHEAIFSQLCTVTFYTSTFDQNIAEVNSYMLI